MTRHNNKSQCRPELIFLSHGDCDVASCDDDDDDDDDDSDFEIIIGDSSSLALPSIR